MAVVAGCGAVTVAANALVSIVSLRLLVCRGGVAVDAGEARIVGRYLMAVVADRSVVRNWEVGVIEGCTEPACCVVAGIAGLRVASGNVIRNGAAQRLRTEPCGLVASIARGVRCGQAVIVADVAVGAGRDLGARGGRHLMGAGKGPACGAVIERAGIPRRGVVARGAKRSREAGGDVIRHNATHGSRAEPVGLMAAVAIGVRACQRVIVVHVAGGARSAKVRASQRPASSAVVKVGTAPACGGVASGAVGQREGGARSRVHGIVRLLPCSQVATRRAARRGSNLQAEIVADVAIGAGIDFSGRHELMQVLQREASRVVAPDGSPIRGGMAIRAL